MDHIIRYRIFYWVPNTLSGERIAVGLCLYDKEADQLNTHWIGQREMNRLQNIFSFANKADSKDVLNLLSETDDNWKSKAYDQSFWNYIESYWNGIVQISEERKLYYEGGKSEFARKSEMLKNQFLPLSDLEPKRHYRRSKTITRNFERWVKEKQIEEKVTLGKEIPEHGKYRLLKSIYLDLGADNGHMIGSAGIDFSLSHKSLTEKAHSYFTGFQSIKNIEKGGDFSLVVHGKGKPYQSTEREDTQLYDDFCYRCEELDIRVLKLDELEDYVDELSDKPDLRPLELEGMEE
jgi:hypothetical protein